MWVVLGFLGTRKKKKKTLFLSQRYGELRQMVPPPGTASTVVSCTAFEARSSGYRRGATGLWPARLLTRHHGQHHHIDRGGERSGESKRSCERFMAMQAQLAICQRPFSFLVLFFFWPQAHILLTFLRPACPNSCLLFFSPHFNLCSFFLSV